MTFTTKRCEAPDLGEQGLDPGAITRLGERMAESHAQQPSITLGEEVPAPAAADVTVDRNQKQQARAPREPGASARLTSTTIGGDHVRESEVGRILREQQEREQEKSFQQGFGLE